MIISINKAIELLNSNDIVALPTETVYGLAGRIDSDSALKKIFQCKRRPLFDPLIVHVKDVSDAIKYSTSWNPLEIYLATKFWPGPLTIIKEKNNSISELITAGLNKVAIRSPDHSIFQEILKSTQCPLAAPSANIFKSTSPTSSQHVLDEFKCEIPVVEGGNCNVGIESTVIEIFIDVNSNYLIHIYRPGIIGPKQIQNALQNTEWYNVPIEYKPSPVSPGQLQEHYRTKKPLEVVLVDSLSTLEKYYHLNNDCLVPKLSTDVHIAARELYGNLRLADKRCSNTQFLTLYFFHELWNHPDWYPLKERLLKAASTIKNLK